MGAVQMTLVLAKNLVQMCSNSIMTTLYVTYHWKALEPSFSMLRGANVSLRTCSWRPCQKLSSNFEMIHSRCPNINLSLHHVINITPSLERINELQLKLWNYGQFSMSIDWKCQVPATLTKSYFPTIRKGVLCKKKKL